MPKVKTHKGSAKRFKVTGTGRVMASRANRRHLLEKKSSNRKRRLRGQSELSPGDSKHVRTLLPYS